MTLLEQAANINSQKPTGMPDGESIAVIRTNPNCFDVFICHKNGKLDKFRKQDDKGAAKLAASTFIPSKQEGELRDVIDRIKPNESIVLTPFDNKRKWKKTVNTVSEFTVEDMRHPDNSDCITLPISFDRAKTSVLDAKNKGTKKAGNAAVVKIRATISKIRDESFHDETSDVLFYHISNAENFAMDAEWNDALDELEKCKEEALGESTEVKRLRIIYAHCEIYTSQNKDKYENSLACEKRVLAELKAAEKKAGTTEKRDDPKCGQCGITTDDRARDGWIAYINRWHCPKCYKQLSNFHSRINGDD